MQIHRTKCAKIQELITLYGNRLVRVNWDNQESISFLTDIKITGIDKHGLINEITRILSNDMNLDIKSFHIDAENGLTQAAISFYVQNTSKLKDALKKLTRIEGITHVNRVN